MYSRYKDGGGGGGGGGGVWVGFVEGNFDSLAVC